MGDEVRSKRVLLSTNSHFSSFQFAAPRPAPLHNCAVRLSEAEYGSPSHYLTNSPLPADKPEALDFVRTSF